MNPPLEPAARTARIFMKAFPWALSWWETGEESVNVVVSPRIAIVVFSPAAGGTVTISCDGKTLAEHDTFDPAGELGAASFAASFIAASPLAVLEKAQAFQFTAATGKAFSGSLPGGGTILHLFDFRKFCVSAPKGKTEWETGSWETTAPDALRELVRENGRRISAVGAGLPSTVRDFHDLAIGKFP